MLKRNGVLIVGLDGATFDLLQPLMDAGLMPTLRRLVETGVSGPLESTVPPVTGPAWASFQTGANPGRHGIVDFLLYTPGSREPRLLDAQAIQAQTVWDVLSEHGRRACAINVPVTYPPRPLNGCMISGLLTPGADSAFTYPPDLQARLLAEVPGYVVVPQAHLATDGVAAFVQTMTHAVQQRLRAALWLMQEEAWDLFMVHFQAVDLVQHALWDHLDPAHPGYAGRSPADRERVRGFYAAVDESLAALLDAAGAASVVVMSDHGFGPARKRVYLNRWLVDQGYMALTASDGWMRAQAALENLVRTLDVFKLRYRLLPRDFKRERGQLIRRLTQDPWIDWARTRAYVFSGSTYAGLYLNLAGREPGGIVAPEDYEALRESLAGCFAGLVDPETGEPVVAQVYRREEVYHGAHAEHLPDLIVRPRGGYMLETRLKGTRLFGPMPSWVTGLHRRDGIYALHGAPFVAGPQRRAAHITDVVPTVLHLLGVPVPESMDGRVLDWAVREDFVPPEPPATSGPALAAEAASAAYTEEETGKVAERLRRLGYL